MKVITDLSKNFSIKYPCAITIGNFDGVHKGHQFLLKKMKEKTKGSTIVITFKNHSTEITKKNAQKTIFDLNTKLFTLGKIGIDYVVILDFNKQLKEKKFDDFLLEIYRFIPFSYLFLGKGAEFGKEKKGNEKTLKLLSQKIGFEAIFIDLLQDKSQNFSSNRIRQELEKKNFEKVQRLLGYPYFIYHKGYLEKSLIKMPQYYLLNLSIKNSFLKDGKYSVTLQNLENEIISALLMIKKNNFRIYFTQKFSSNTAFTIIFQKNTKAQQCQTSLAVS